MATGTTDYEKRVKSELKALSAWLDIRYNEQGKGIAMANPKRKMAVIKGCVG